MAKYTVTGGSGFLGTALIRKLLDNGHEVIAIAGSRRIYQEKNLVVLNFDELNLQQLGECMEGSEAVFHLATYFANDDSNLLKMINANVNFSLILAKACGIANIKYFINLESMTQHIDGDFENAKTFYAQTKAIGAKSIELLARDKFSVMNLALFDTYGPNDSRNKLLQTLLERDQGMSPLELSLGNQLVDYLHQRDVVEGILSSLKYMQNQHWGIKNFRFRLGSTELCTLKELVKMLEEASSCEFNITWGARDYRPGEMFKNWNFPEYLPNWSSQISLRQGLRDLISPDE